MSTHRRLFILVRVVAFPPFTTTVLKVSLAELQGAELDHIVQDSLNVSWRPRTCVNHLCSVNSLTVFAYSHDAFTNTMTCANAMIDLLDRVRQNPENAQPKKRLYYLPLDIVENILGHALTSNGDPGRCIFQRVCRLFRAIIFERQALWRDAGTYSCVPTEFMLASWRSRWTGTHSRIQLDSSNRGLSVIPHSALLYAVFADVSSIIVEHHLSNVGVIRMLSKLRSYPNLVELVLQSTARHPSETRELREFNTFFTAGTVPSFSAPRLRFLQSVSGYFLAPDSKSLVDVRLSGRFVDLIDDDFFVDEDEPLDVYVRTRWPSNVIWTLLRGQNNLTNLHLTDAVRGLDERYPGSLSLPALKNIRVCTTTTGEAVWIFETLVLPEESYINVCVGYGARYSGGLNLRKLFKSLGTFPCTGYVRPLTRCTRGMR